MTTVLEREVKLRFDSVDDARAAVAGSDATPVRSRRLRRTTCSMNRTRR